MEDGSTRHAEEFTLRAGGGWCEKGESKKWQKMEGEKEQEETEREMFCLH